MTKGRRWALGGLTLCGVIVLVGLFVIHRFRGRVEPILQEQVEPVLKEQIVQRLSDDFDADVDLAGLNISLVPTGGWLNPTAKVRLDGIVIRRKDERDAPPVLTLRRISFSVNARDVLKGRGRIPAVEIDGLTIDVPPKAKRAGGPLENIRNRGTRSHPKIDVHEIHITNARLIIRPVDSAKRPLDFEIQRVHLWIDGPDRPLHYEASLINPRPPGQINARGLFGPWENDDPGLSRLAGTYTFQNADLGVFAGIAGTLQSVGSFNGQLSRVEAHGEADVPNFRLRIANHPVPLKTQFSALIDGRNGNTILQPVHAQLGRSRFTTSGAVVKFDPESGRTIDLTTHIKSGNLRDFMDLGVKGPPLMDGVLNLDARIQIPPLSRKVEKKLHVQANFSILKGMFLKSALEQRITELSRRAEGHPKTADEDTGQAISEMRGSLVMENEKIQFQSLAFDIPGTYVSLTGMYNLEDESLDFHGTALLKAKLSQTQTSFKRWLLKPIDPFFEKDGAGAVLPVQITGTRDSPKFGLELHRKKDKDGNYPLTVGR